MEYCFTPSRGKACTNMNCSQNKNSGTCWIGYLLEEHILHPKIVRCIECKSYLPPVVSRDLGVCERRDLLVEITDFCSQGKSR